MKTFVSAFFSKDGLEELKRFGTVNTKGWGFGGKQPLKKSELLKQLQDKDLLVTEIDQVTEEVMKKAGSLKIIACARGNPVNVDTDFATKEKIPVLHAPGRNANSVAELTLVFLLSLSRNIWKSAQNLSDGNWYYQNTHPYQAFQGSSIVEKTLGIVGFGAVGKRVAQKATANEMKVLVYDPLVNEEEIKRFEAVPVMMSKLLSRSDFVSLHCNVNPQTKGIIGSHELNLMKPSAYLINTARSAVVEKDALLKALREDEIAGAALDVFEKEPLPEDDPLFDLPNALMTPHIGGAARGVKEDHSKQLINGVMDLLRDEKPPNLFNPDVWKHWKSNNRNWKERTLIHSS